MFENSKPFTGAGETAVRLMLRYPWFMGLYYSMHLYECRDMPMKTLATNGTSIWVDPDFWGQLNRDQRMTAVAHEMGHKMLLHVTRLGDRNRFMWNIAGDHVINLMLMESGFTPLKDMTINGKPWSWFCDQKYKGWTTEQVYDDVQQEYEDKCKKGKGGKDAGELAEGDIGEAGDLVSFGETPDGGKDETEGAGGGRETMEEFEQRVRKELKEAEQMAKMAGTVPAWMKRTINNADYSKVNWYDVLEQHMKALTIADYSWSRFNRREFVKTGCIAPDMWQPAMGGVKVYIDCSGSIDGATLSKFTKHIRDVLEQVKPKWTEVSYFETDVHHGNDHRFERGEVEIELQPIGGGGTSFAWLRDDVREMDEQPEVILFLTDMYGPFGPEPDVPVFWVSVSAVNQAPFGEVVNVN